MGHVRVAGVGSIIGLVHRPGSRKGVDVGHQPLEHGSTVGIRENRQRAFATGERDGLPVNGSAVDKFGGANKLHFQSGWLRCVVVVDAVGEQKCRCCEGYRGASVLLKYSF